MGPLSIASMILVCGVIWGGLAILLVRALGAEAQRDRGC